MSTAIDVILLERIDNLGNMGEVVKVKPGYARNYLLPQSKALRATQDNIAYFESQKAHLEKLNSEKKKSAEKEAKSVEGLTVTIVRHASESGQLYGSVAARDIAEAINETAKIKISRGQVVINDAFKSIGLFPVEISLHPEVKVEVRMNIARSLDEAEIQLKTGKALIADEGETVEETATDLIRKADEASEEIKEEMLEDSALEAEKEAKEAAEAEAEAAAKAAAEEEAKAAAEAEEAAAEEASEAATEEENKDA